MFDLDFRGRDERVNAAPVARGLHSGSRRVDVLEDAPGEPADDGALDFFGDFADRFEIAVADDWKAGLDHVHIQACELPGDFHLFPQIHGGAGALFPVAQGGIENNDFV